MQGRELTHEDHTEFHMPHLFQLLQDYLETKRIFFPRFYFISSSDVLGQFCTNVTFPCKPLHSVHCAVSICRYSFQGLKSEGYHQAIPTMSRRPSIVVNVIL